MGEFLEQEKQRQIALKGHGHVFSAQAREPGVYRRKPRDFCLPLEHAAENLAPDIRDQAIVYFMRNKIKWHDGRTEKPSNHLCSSQVCCVNFLYPFADKPQALVELLRPIYPKIRQALPIEDDHLVAFEWIGEKNYLKEKMRGDKRTRGAYFTSADAAVLFERTDGLRQMVLIEWKYTESYGGQYLAVSKSGTSRVDIYRHLVEDSTCPLVMDRVEDFENLFYEPFYQFMRQQLLAHKMEQAREKNAAVVSVLHIEPGLNQEFQRITSPGLRGVGNSAVEVWKRLLKNQDGFESVTTERLFGGLGAHPQLQSWWSYILERYSTLIRAV